MWIRKLITLMGLVLTLGHAYAQAACENMIFLPNSLAIFNSPTTCTSGRITGNNNHSSLSIINNANVTFKSFNLGSNTLNVNMQIIASPIFRGSPPSLNMGTLTSNNDGQIAINLTPFESINPQTTLSMTLQFALTSTSTVKVTVTNNTPCKVMLVLPGWTGPLLLPTKTTQIQFTPQNDTSRATTKSTAKKTSDDDNAKTKSTAQKISDDDTRVRS